MEIIFLKNKIKKYHTSPLLNHLNKLRLVDNCATILERIRSEYANYSLGRSQDEQLYTIFHCTGDTAGSLYDYLRKVDDDRTKAKSDLKLNIVLY